MSKAWSWLKRNALWVALVAIGVLLAAAAVLAAMLRAERAQRKLQEALAKARAKALEARHGRQVEVDAAEEKAEEERAATEAEHAAEVEAPTKVGERLDAAVGDPDAELEEVNAWIRSQE